MGKNGKNKMAITKVIYDHTLSNDNRTCLGVFENTEVGKHIKDYSSTTHNI